MNRISSQALSLAPPAIRALVVLNAIYAVCLIAAFTYSFFITGWPVRPLGAELVAQHPRIGIGLRTIVVIGLLGAGVMHTILRRLLAIVGTVREGNPFILDNARRLEQIAWRLVALEVLRVCVAAVAAATWEAGRISAFSIAPWLAVLLLFVLAGVFAHGSRMRDDLDGTV
jgi:hypothetical protein